MKREIIDPKVFISYAWGTDDYQEKVLSFATRLQHEMGIEVVIDKWSMDAGNDTVSFMEKCVRDDSIDFVVILLDKNYCDKADERKGGVGTETQIISKKVYEDVAQSKFVPVIFERDKNGEVCKPVYLESRLHFDLTGLNAEDEFRRLVRHLYGRDTYPIPPKGSKPKWIDEAPIYSVGMYSKINRLNSNVNKKSALISILESIENEIIVERFTQSAAPSDITNAIDGNKELRDAYITCIEETIDDPSMVDVIADFFESFNNRIDVCNDGISQSICKFFIYELFIYTVALLWKNQCYSNISNLIERTYFINNKYSQNCECNFVDLIYPNDCRIIEWALSENYKGKNYISNTAQYIISRLNTKINQELFVFADLLIFNLDIMKVNNYPQWFPSFYIYSNYNYSNTNNDLKLLANRLKSKYQLKRLVGLFGSDDVEHIKKLMMPMQELKKDGIRDFRYNGVFHRAPIILDYIKIDDIGTLN